MTVEQRILIVDDERRNRSLVAAYLSTAYRVLEASTGAEALQAVDRDAPDLVLLDVMMPGLSGYDVCRQIKARAGAGQFLPVILVTALHAQEDRNEGLQAGADDFLSKPVNRTELLLRCAAFLRLRKQDRLIRGQVGDLRRLQELKEDLFALIVHDLRNPLTGIDGYLQIIGAQLSSDTDPALRGDVERALQGARKLRGMIDGVLDVRLLEEGELKLTLADADLADIVADAVATLAGAGEAMRVPIRSTVPPRTTVRVDQKLMRRAVENLLANAIKYSPRQAEVEVGVEPGPAGVAITVADRGPGIPDPYKASMFEKFGSVEVKQGSQRRGYGLGLHLVKLVARAHGGDVSVADRPGGGSVFRMGLPRGGGAAVAGAGGAPAGAAAG